MGFFLLLPWYQHIEEAKASWTRFITYHREMWRNQDSVEAHCYHRRIRRRGLQCTGVILIIFLLVGWWSMYSAMQHERLKAPERQCTAMLREIPDLCGWVVDQHLCLRGGFHSEPFTIPTQYLGPFIRTRERNRDCPQIVHTRNRSTTVILPDGQTFTGESAICIQHLTEHSSICGGSTLVDQTDG